MNIKNNIILFLLLFKTILVLGQERPPVLRLLGANGYTTHFDTKNYITSQLVNTGSVGQATIEFWIMKGHNHPRLSREIHEESWLYSNLLTGSDEFTIAGTENELSVTMGTQTEMINFPVDSNSQNEEFWDNQWHHVAITINKGNTNLKVYVDGTRHLTTSYATNFNPERMYVMVTEDDQLSFAEYRAWNRERTSQEIEDNRFLTYSNTNSTNLQSLRSVGLVTAYVDNETSEERINNLPLSEFLWYDLLSASTNTLDNSAFSRVTSEVASNDVQIAELTTEVDHPIFSLTDVLLSASDGGGVTRGGARTVYLRWPHIRGGSTYTINRRNLRDANSLPARLATVTAPSQHAISNYLEYFDNQTLPNEIYEYTVIADGINNSTPGVDNGFVFANGIVAGTIEAPSKVAAQDVLVEANVSNDADMFPGRALEFRRGSGPININDVSLFQQANGNGTIEFWYRTPTIGTATNTIFKLSEGEIRINNGNITIISRDATNPTSLTPITYLSAEKPNDNLWHHYAFTFSPTGGALYIDGGVRQPSNRENPIVANKETNRPFFVGLNRTSRFSFNANSGNTYELDEVRIWGMKRNVSDISKYWRHILGNNNDPNLLAYYRFDMNDPHNVYNQAGTTLGRFRGTSVQALQTAVQPYESIERNGEMMNIPIGYAVYTDTEGRYRFNSINSGRQNPNRPNTFLSYRIKPREANEIENPETPEDRFSPSSTINDIERSLNPREPSATDFIDNASFDITGKVVYRVSNDGGMPIEYPTVQNTRVLLDGTVVTSAEEGTSVNTNTEGRYIISAAPGRHIVAIGQPEFNEETQQLEIDRVSLDFEREENGYAVSAENITEVVNQGFTWSGFVKPDIFIPEVGSENEVEIPAIQTVLQWGNLRLELRENTRLVLLSGTVELFSKEIDVDTASYTFFAITRDATNNIIGFQVNDDYQTKAYTESPIDSKLYLGATYNGVNDITNFSLANTDIIEYRNVYYTTGQLTNIMEGHVIDNDEENLKLSYTFEHRIGERAINLAVNSGTSNNYLELKQGAKFNNRSSSQYRRSFEFSYKTFEDGDSADLRNPRNNEEYLFNVASRPISNINFENITRRTFVGNVVVPCNNDVGNWMGTITRTDIAFPEFSREITSSDFNSENNLFTIHDLLPGQYRVEIRRVDGNGRPLSSGIIDLRNGNKSADFSARNPLQAEVAIYDLSIEEFRTLERSELQSKIISPTCDDDRYTMEQNSNIYIEVSVYEEYNGVRCPVEGATVGLSGDMIIAQATGTTDENGRNGTLIATGQPNFIGDFTRNMAVTVNHDNRNLPSPLTISAYITGSQMGNDDFTLTDPDVGFILYDPPGDASSSTLVRGASYSFNHSVGGGLDINSSTSIGSGDETSVSLVQVQGLGVSTGTSYIITETNTDVRGTINANATYRHTEQNGFSVSLNQSISTSSSDDIVGADADVFIGASKVLVFGTGRALTVTNCQASINNNSNVVTIDELVPFVFTRQDIEDRVIRNLQERLIQAYDGITPPTQEELENRNALDLQATIDGFSIDIALESTDKTIGNLLFQIEEWQRIVKRRTRAEQLIYFNNETNSFAETTTKLTTVGSNLGETITGLDSQITLDGGGTTTTYTLTRANQQSNQDSGGTSGGASTTSNIERSIFGISIELNSEHSVSAVTEASDNNENENSREDSFTLTDSDVGDQFFVRIARDRNYDTPIFYTVGGQSVCPFESGTVPREGVEVTVDNAIKYGTGNQIIYDLTLRNTQRANDATRKPYIIDINTGTNPEGARLLFNGAELNNGPQTVVFGLDPSNSETGVQNEIKAQLIVQRGAAATSGDVSYENLEIRMYSACEQAGDGYRSYRTAEYEEVGVVPLQSILITANFTDACINEIEADLPAESWVVNGEDNNRLDFRFRIPEIGKTDDDTAVVSTFSVDLEYAIEGNNQPRILESLSLAQLQENLQNDGFITYSADVSALVDGEYSFRVTPVCNLTREDPANRQNPTEFVQGRIARVAPVVISTNPVNGGMLTEGQITVAYDRAINPQTAIASSFSLRGILGGLPQDLVAAEFAQISDEVIVPHQTEFDLTGAFTLEMWVNPSTLPSGRNVPILQKGNNYSVKLSPQGNIVINNVVTSSRRLQPLSWTHVAAVYDGAGIVTIYFNGVSVGSGRIEVLESNEDAIEIAKSENGVSYIGKLDEVRIWTTNRSPNEIVENLDEQLVGNETNLSAYFVFDDNAVRGAGGTREAIRDYTGNAAGTTAVGLEFVRGETNAAPLDITRLAEDLQFEIITSNNNREVHIIPLNTARFVEGAQLTAMILNRRLQDPAGNKIAKTSWSFIVNRNTIHWSQNNKVVNQEQGQSIRVNDIDLDNSEGGSPIRYRFRNLAPWLSVERVVGQSVTRIAEGEDNNLAAGFVESNLEFIVAPYLNQGTHSTDVFIEVFQVLDGREVPIGVEAFNLVVNVNCPTPNFANGFSSNSFLGEMNFTGRLFLNGTQSLDTGDIVVAYLNNEYRGQANVETNGLVNLSLAGNNNESGSLTFNVWDASECTEYRGIVETYTYAFRGVQGSVSSPVTFTVGDRLTRRLTVENGFQEVSFNVKDNNSSNNLSLAAITGLTAGDRILDAATIDLIATVNPDGSFTTVGSIETIDVRKAYILSTTSAKTIVVEGVPVPIDTDINIVEKARVPERETVNAIPYFPNNLQTVSLALRSLTSTTISEGDIIRRRGLSAQYTSNGWVGSLTHLTPGFGYIYVAENNGVLNYSGLASTPQARGEVNIQTQNSLEFLEKAKEINWEVDRNRYPSFMYMTANISSDDLDEDKEYIIAAFVKDEVRGVAKAVMIDDEYRYFIGVGGFSNDEVSFKLFDGEKIVTLDNTISFDRTDVKGNVENPYTLTYIAKSIDDVNTIVNNGYSLGQNTPNPMTNSTKITYSIPQTEFVDISLYNLLGQKVHTFVSKKVEGNKVHTITWNKATSEIPVNRGVYLYKLISGNEVLTRKLVIK